MSDWSFKELEKWDKEICKVGRDLGMEWYPIEYEVIDYHEMIGAMAYVGMPTHYRHWSYGKSFERTQTMYNLGMEGLPYEMIINSNPSIAYLMKENPMSTHLLTMSHCIGHSHFFKNNRMFAETDPDNVISRFKNAAKRINKYMADPNIGVEKVEAALDSCHAIRYQIPRTPGIKRRTLAEQREDLIVRINRGDAGVDEFDLARNPIVPEQNLLLFIRDNCRNMPEWKKDILTIVERESQYFLPQAYTKIMNEGLACAGHYKIMNTLKLPQEYQLAFIKLHNQVVRPHLGRINPYHLGFHMLQEIEKRDGWSAVIEACALHNDESFLRRFLDYDICNELNLFSYSFKRQRRAHTIDSVSSKDGWKSVREALITNVGLNSVPVFKVINLGLNDALYLQHEHDGRDLDIPTANKVLNHIANLWDGDVMATTILEGELWEF